jgi:hypothetical protein
MVLAALAGAANAQSIDFRVVERTGQSVVAQGGDVILDLAVQARVNGGSALGGFGFNAVINGEADTNGTLALGRISNSDGTYNNTFAVSSAVGLGGLARSYTYLAGINAAFNGQINNSNGTFTNTPANQEIGLITGSALSSALLGTPGVDPNGEANPATWSGYGSGNTPAANATASLDPAIGAAYFGQGSFVDVYRFRYTVTNFTTRTLNITLQGLTSQVFSQFVFSNNAWGLNTSTFAGTVNLTPLSINVTPAPASAALLGLGGLVAARRRRTA